MLLVVRKRDSRYKGRSSFLLEARLQDGNRIDCSRGACFCWVAGVGDSLAGAEDERVTRRLIVFAAYMGRV